MGYNIRNHSYYLEAAADAPNIERLKLIVANFISSLHFMMVADKPFNPVIGETFQLKSGNSIYYAEQTSHHPPVSTFYVKNPKFIMYGSQGLEIGMGANSATFSFVGKTIIRFNDGDEYSFKYPESYCEGVMFGRTYLTFTSSMVCEDLVKLTLKCRQMV